MRYIALLLAIGFTQLVQSQSSQVGGFIYEWSSYTNDESTGLGPRIVNWDSTDLAPIVHAPAVGVHPRVYFGPSEMPDILNRLDNTASGNEAKATIHAYATLLHLGASYNQNASYALDPDGNRYISNSGAWNMEPYYTALKNHDPTVWDGVPIKTRHRTAALMSLEAFMCLFYPSDNDPDVGLDYATRAADLADAMSFWASLSINDPNTNPNGQNFNNFGGTHMALCYDLNYNNLSVSQRDSIRQVLSQIIPDSPRHGGETTCYANTSNWSTLNSFEIIINLAMEGEPGYKPQLTTEWMRALHTFINYGWYPSGAGYEGLGKNYQFVTTLIACAKRGYGLLSHPHVRAYGEEFLPAIMQPFGAGFTSYDVWGGSGYDEERGMYKFNSSDAVGLKWAFPSSEKIDFVWKNYIQEFHQNDSKGYVYAQVYPDDSYNNYLIPAAVFAKDYSTDDWQSQANTVQSTDYVAEDRGLTVFKSDVDSLGLSTQFHARQDMGGHTHGDRLDFTLSGLGRIWIRKSYGGSQFQTSKYHSMVLVDDKGVPVGDPDGDKCRQPATLLNYSITPNLSKAAGDATYAYNWEYHWSPQSPGNDHPWLGNNGWEAVNESWNDFLVTPQSEAHYSTPFYDYGHWTQPGKLERMVKREYNTMDKVVRNIGLFRGNHPMVLVVDDIQKDSSVHNYKWLGQIARDLSLDYYDVNLSNTDYRCDIVLKEPSSLGNRRLLVRVLENNGYNGSTDPGYIDTVDYIDFFTGNPFNPNPNWDRPRLIIESNSVSPNFKVLLFPFEMGDELPVTNWNETNDTLAILFSDEERLIHFYSDSLDNTEFDFVQVIDTSSVNELVASNILRAYPNPTANKVTIQSSQLMSMVKVRSLNGSLVHFQENLNTQSLDFDIRHLEAGIYLVIAQYHDGSRNMIKIVVQ